MDSSPFSRLPPELRNKVFEYALYQEPSVIIKSFPTPHDDSENPLTPSPSPTALTRTCRAIHRDYARVFYAINTFSLCVDTKKQLKPEIKRLSSSIGPANMKLINSVIVDLGTAAMTVSGKITMNIRILAMRLEGIVHYVLKGRLDHYWARKVLRIRAVIIDKSDAESPPGVSKIDLDCSDIETSLDSNIEMLRKHINTANDSGANMAISMLRWVRSTVESLKGR